MGKLKQLETDVEWYRIDILEAIDRGDEYRLKSIDEVIEEDYLTRPNFELRFLEDSLKALRQIISLYISGEHTYALYLAENFYDLSY